MAQVLHGCARTTQAVRTELQNSQKEATELAKEYKINRKTVARRRKRNYVEDTPMGPKNPRSTVLSIEEEAMIVTFRKHTLLPLDDCLYTLQEKIPHLTRSSLYRCLKRHGVNKLPEENVQNKQTKKFAKYTEGYLHMDITQMRTEEGKRYLFVAIDRNSKFACAELYSNQTKKTTAEFLQKVIKRFPYKIQIILTDNGIQFTHRPQDKYAAKHLFDQICETHKIEHRLTKVNHPWMNGQVERMNRTLKEATVKKYHCKTHEELKKHLANFLDVYNFAKKLKTLKGLTPYEKIVCIFESNP
uniref:IS481 family transposase n=1 Tax=Pseudoalteromonas sp. TaxID=53249 RepID=UPI0023559428